MKGKLKDLSTSLRLLVIGFVIFSLAYSGIIGLIGQAIWDSEAEGSLIKHDGKVVGSELIGQDFEDNSLFHGRVSSIDYDATRSGSQNLGPVENSGLENRVREDLIEYSNKYENKSEIPADLITESGSALDPHITVKSALFQVPRVARNTPLSEEELKSLVREHSEDKLLGLYGLKRINVLRLNLELKTLMEES